MNAPRYRIDTVRDFLRVPVDRLPVCLEEFSRFLELARDVETRSPGVMVSSYQWIDDGKRDESITILPAPKINWFRLALVSGALVSFVGFAALGIVTFVRWVF